MKKLYLQKLHIGITRRESYFSTRESFFKSHGFSFLKIYQTRGRRKRDARWSVPFYLQLNARYLDDVDDSQYKDILTRYVSSLRFA